MAIVQSKGGSGVTSLTFDSTTATGSHIVVATVRFATDIGTTAVSDNKGNTYTRVGVNNSVSPKSAIFVSQDSPTLGASHQVSIVGGDNLAIFEVSGLTTSPFDKTATSAAGPPGGTPADTTNTTTLAQADEEVFAVVSVDSGSISVTEDAGQSWTTVIEEENGVAFLVYSAVHKTVAAPTALSATWALGTNNGWSGCIATFKKAASGNTGNPVLDPFTSTASGTVVNPPAVTHVKEVGFVTNTTAGSTSTIAVAAGGVPPGDTVVIYGACDNTGASGAATTITVTDTQSNSWTTQTPVAIADPGAASAGQQGFFVVSNVTTALQAGDTITITYGNSTTAKAINAQQFHGVHLTTPILASTYATQNNQTGTTSSVAATATAAFQAVCALVAVEGGTADSYTEDADTTNGAWVTLTRRGSGTTTSGSTLNSVYKLVTASGAQTYDPTLGTSRDHCAAVLILNVQTPWTGTVAQTLDSFTSSATGTFTTGISGSVTVTLAGFTPAASGTVTVPGTTGTVAATLDAFTSTASGTHAPPGISGTVAVTLASFTPAASGHFSLVLYPASISGNKILDQNGDVYLAYVFSSWGMASHLSDADITIALEDVAENHFNGVTVWMGGTEDRGITGWDRYTNLVGDNYWTGTPWQSSLGPAWSSVDHLIDEANRLGIIVHFSFCSGNSDFGAGPDWETATNAQMRQVGIDVATRYDAYDNIVWHIMYDGNPNATRVTRANALFDGINDTEGATRRPVRWTEVDPGSTTFDRGFYDPTGATSDTRFSINCAYWYGGESVEALENPRAEITTGVIGDCEPFYVGNPYPSGNSGQQYRERNYAVFLEGGCLLNFGHECWWPFGAAPLVGSCTDWAGVVDDAEVVEARHAWDLIDAYCKDATFEATTSFVTTGQGTGDARAAIGASNNAALAYFPDNRTIAVDTTIIAGSGNVRLRWYDPTAGSYSTITASEPQQTGRSVTLPAARGDGTRDFVLVVDAVNDVAGSVTVTLAGFTPAASGTVTVPGTTGTVAVTLASFTPAASGTSTPPEFTGTVAITLAGFAPTASGTSTPPAFTGTVAVTLASFTPAASGTSTPPTFSGTVAVTLAAFTTSAAGTATPPAFTGTVAQTLAPFIAAAAGTFAPAGSGFAAVTLAPFTSSASGTSTPPVVTGTVAVTLAAFTSSASGTSSPPGGPASIDIQVSIGPPVFASHIAGAVAVVLRLASIAFQAHTAGTPQAIPHNAGDPTFPTRVAGGPDTQDRDAGVAIVQVREATLALGHGQLDHTL